MSEATENAKAVFLDRDGVINPLVYNPVTLVYESPNSPDDFEVYPYVKKSLELLKLSGYKTIVVSNQPSFAKGKATWENIKEIERKLYDFSVGNGCLLDDYYYCYHHPEGIVPEYSIVCKCRKPGTLLPEQAVNKYDLDKSLCYFIGDSDTDIMCGKAMGFVTVRIGSERPVSNSGAVAPDMFASDLYKAVLDIVNRR